MMNSSFSRRTLLVLAAGAVTFATAFAAQAETTLERGKREGYLRVGFANEAPYGFATPDGKLTGESPEVVKAILAKIGIAQVDGVLTEFGSLIPGLQAGRFDIIAAGMFVNPKRCEQVQFSEPTYGIGQAFLVKAGNPKGIVDYSTVSGNADLKLAVMAGAVEGGYAKDSGIPEGQLVILPDQSSLVKAVQAGRADAAALTALSIADMASKNDGVEFDEAVWHGRRQVGRRPRRRRLPQGGQGPLRGLQRRAEEVHRQPRAHRACHAVRLRRRLPPDEDH